MAVIFSPGEGVKRLTGLVAPGSDYAAVTWYRPDPTVGGSGRAPWAVYNSAYDEWIAIFSTMAAPNEYYISIATGGVEVATSAAFERPIGIVANFAYVREGTAHRMYLNGVLVATATYDTSGFTHDELWLAGEAYNSAVLGFREWSRALTGAELLAELRSTTAVDATALVTDTPLVGDYLDLTANNNDWTAVGSPSLDAGVLVPRLRGAASETLVLSHDFTAESAPFYGDVPNYWQTPDWPTGSYAAVPAAFPTLIVAEAANLDSRGLTYAGAGGTHDDQNDAQLSAAVFGIPDPATNGNLLPFVSGNLGQRTISARAVYGFERGIYAVADVTYAPLFQWYAHRLLTRAITFAAEQTGGAASDVDLTLQWNTAGHAGGSATLYTLPYEAIDESTGDGLALDIRLDVTPSTPAGDPVTGDEGDNFNADATIRLWLNDVLHYELTGDYAVFNFGGLSDYEDNYKLGALGLGYAGIPGWIEAVSFGYLGADPTPGGEVPSGTPPAAAAVPNGDILRAWFTLSLGDEIIGRAEVTLNDDADFQGGPKPGEVLEWSTIKRELAEERRPVEARVVVADASKFWRATADAQTIATAYAEILVETDADRYAKAEPYRIFGGRVTAHGGLPGLGYEFELRDTLSEMLGKSDDPPPMPDNPMTRSLFPGLLEANEGKVIPWLYGHVTDEDADVPQGSVQVWILGHVNFLEAWGGIDKRVVAGVLCAGAVAGAASAQGFYNNPDTPDVRLAIPDSAFGGNPCWMPGKPGWSDTGLTGDYADYPLPLSSATRRYTPFFVDDAHPLAQAYFEGRVLVAFNLWGRGPDPEGGSVYFSDPSRIWQDLIVNGRFVPYRTGDYADIPTLDGTISIIDTDSVERTRTRQRARLADGYPVGRVIGRDGNPEAFEAVLNELCVGADMQQGTDRHGRAIIDTEDASAEPVATLSDLHDIETGTFRVYTDRSRFFNRLVHFWGERYVAPSAPRAASAAGEPVPTPIAPYSEWISGYNELTNTGAVTANRDFIRTRRIENRWVRTAALAAHLEGVWLARAAGYSAAQDGPRVFELTGPLRRLLGLELGDNVLLDAIEGYGGDGYIGAVARITGIEHNLQTRRARIWGDVLTAGAGT